MRFSTRLLHGLACALLAAATPVADASPQRIVALAPSAAEIVYALGAAERVVGVSDFAADLPESRGKVKLGGFAPDLERIAALRPDLAVVSR
ncbi:MAG TPA: ABC transporter substrate-binding protein, partial [Thermoanaerobaculia bacterium]|nr:ABC transporter substrate-binding protein [Thermoanaerobaculia bacterium]